MEAVVVVVVDFASVIIETLAVLVAFGTCKACRRINCGFPT